MPSQDRGRPHRHYGRYLLLPIAILATGLYLLLSSPSGINQDTVPIRLLPNSHAACTSTPSVKRIAIIGAGSAGTSTAYYLARAQVSGDIDPCTNLSITIFERNGYIGGRSTTVHPYISRSDSKTSQIDHLPAQDLTFPETVIPSLELGGSVFVRVNTNLVHAAQALNLTVSSASNSPGTSIYSLGIWDGGSFRFLSKENDSWWYELGKLLYRYGLSPLWTQRAMKGTVGKFLQMYQAPLFPWASLTSVVAAVGLNSTTGTTGRAFLAEKGISTTFSEDVIQASTRVNYAQNLEQIHGLETMVCMAAEGAMNVKGGNWQIFAGMARESGAEVRLNTSILSISSQDAGKDTGFAVTYAPRIPNDNNGVYLPPLTEYYDHVILATPLQFSSINTTGLSPSLQSNLPKPISYVKLHVTLLATKHRFSPTFFGSDSQDAVPEIILTTLPPLENSSSRGNTQAPEFFSISTLRNLTNPSTSEREYAYKIFSHSIPSPEFLASLFGFPASKAEEEISWLYRHVWDSYPYLPPRQTFDGPALGEGLWYTSGIESFISTMETSSLAGRNVAALIVKEINQDAAQTVEQSGLMSGKRHDDI